MAAVSQASLNDLRQQQRSGQQLLISVWRGRTPERPAIFGKLQRLSPMSWAWSVSQSRPKLIQINAL